MKNIKMAWLIVKTYWRYPALMFSLLHLLWIVAVCELIGGKDAH